MDHMGPSTIVLTSSELERLISTAVKSVLLGNGTITVDDGGAVAGTTTVDGAAADTIAVDGVVVDGGGAGTITVDGVAADTIAVDGVVVDGGGAGTITVDGAAGGTIAVDGDEFNTVGRKRKISCEDNTGLKKKKPISEVHPYSKSKDVNLNYEATNPFLLRTPSPVASSTDPMFLAPTTPTAESLFGLPPASTTDPMFSAPPTPNAESLFGLPPASTRDPMFSAPTTPSAESLFGLPPAASTTDPMFSAPTTSSAESLFRPPLASTTDPMFLPPPNQNDRAISPLNYTLPPTNYQSPNRTVSPLNPHNYTLPPTNYQTPNHSYEENDVLPLHSTPLHASTPLSLNCTLPSINSPKETQNEVADINSLLGSISQTFEDGNAEQDVGREEEEDVGREEEEDVGREEEEDVGREEEDEQDVGKDYEDIFKKQNEDVNRLPIPDHESLRMMIKNQTYLRKEDRISASKFSPFMVEWSSNMMILQRSTMVAIQGLLKQHQEISSGLMMSIFSKYTGLEFIDESERKKKNWLNLAIKNFSERVIGKNIK